MLPVKKKEEYTYEELREMEPESISWETPPRATAYVIPDPNTYSASGTPFESQIVITGYPTMLGHRVVKKFYASEILLSLLQNLDYPVIDLRPDKPYRVIKSLHIEEVIL